MKQKRKPTRRLDDYLWIPETVTTLSTPKKHTIDPAALEKAAREFRRFLEEVAADEARAPRDPQAIASHS